jgi:hypothetical protein
MGVRWSSVELTLLPSSPADGAQSPAISSALAQPAVDFNNTQHNPGVYRLLTDASGITIAPSQVKNLNCDLVSASSPLDTLITFPESLRSGWEGVEMIVSQLLSSLTWTSDAVRKVVPQRNIALRLFYDADITDRGYALNLHIVEIERPDPAGGDPKHLRRIPVQ